MLEHILLREIVEQVCLGREVLDEPMVEDCEAQEFSNISEVTGLWLVGDGGDFAMVHAYTPEFNDHTKVLNVIAIEFALLWF